MEQYNIFLELAALIFDVILIFTMRYQSSFNDNGVGNAFFRMALCVLLGTALDVISAITIGFGAGVPMFVNMCLNTVYFMVLAFCAYFYAAYIEAYVYRDKTPKIRLFHGILMLGVLGILLVNVWTNIIFWFDEAGAYQHGVVYLLVYVIPLYYIFYSIVLMLRHRKTLSVKQVVSFIIYLGLVIAGMVLQLLVFPGILLTFFGASIAVMGSYFSLESPDYNMLVKTMAELEESRSSAEKLAAEVQELNRSRSSFLSGFSQEIRTPINAVIGYNNRLRKEQDPARIRECSDGIDSAGKILMALVNDVVDYIGFDPDSGLGLEQKPYEVRKLFENLSDYAEYHLGSRNVWFESAVAKSVPTHLCGDRTRITQIANNLITTAIKNTQTGTITTRVRWQQGSDPDAGILVITVSDTGIGMKEEELTLLRDYLERIHREPNSRETYSEMGMTVVARLLAVMGGTISVESLWGRGTNVTVRIPQEISREEEIIQKPEAGVPQIGFAAGDGKNAGELSPVPVRIKKKNSPKDREEAESVFETAAAALPATGEASLKEADERDAENTGELSKEKTAENGSGVTRRTPVADQTVPESLPFLAKEYYSPSDPPYTKVVLMQLSQVLDVMIGLSYCMEDEDMYMDILRSYVDNNIFRELEYQIKSGDWNTYREKVRALKSSSKTIGAVALSEMCRDLETLAGSNKLTEIPIRHDVMMSQYQLILTSLSEALENGIRVTRERREQMLRALETDSPRKGGE